MSKFRDVVAEAGHAIAGHGFTEEEAGNVSEGTPWQAVVVISPVLLLNVEEQELAYRLGRWLIHNHMPEDQTLYVWLSEDTQGFVDVEMWAQNLDAVLSEYTTFIDREYGEDEPPELTETCPEHGIQRVTGESTTKGPDPYAVYHLACGHRVSCFGPGEDNVILGSVKARPRRRDRE